MPTLDLRTILVAYICGNVVCAIVLFSLWKENRTRFSGIGYWAFSFVCNLMGIALLATRGAIPDFFSMLLGSLFLVIGTYLLYIGFELFLQLRTSHVHIYLILVVYVFLQTYFIYLYPNLAIRNILFSAALVVFSFQFAWLFYRRADLETRKIIHNIGVITSLFGLIAIARVVITLLIPPGTDPMNAAGYEAVIYLTFQMLYIILTISLFMMVNRRLQIALQADIAFREKTEKELTVSQEKYSKAFLASPDAILISRIDDGRIIEANDSFSRMIEYSHEECLNASTLSLGLWNNPAERDNFVNIMKTNHRVEGFEFLARNKNGKVFLVEISSEYILLQDEECMLSIIRDISERKRMEEIAKIRLRLWDYSILHSPVEVMQKALDEIEILTGSQIGFYHLVDEDSKTLSLQAWSTRTLNEFCHAEGDGMHYSIDKAGIWVDCIRVRKAVIHNDYAAVPNKKGMPEGHAKVTREMVVPIMMEDQVVSILGIGNKATDYNQQDVDLVTYMADLVWTIVAKMRADEKIKALNDRLETLAMTDELTRIPNRRYFFLRGNEEISRTRRYKNPLSLIMLDIDKFKNINDTYGHDIGDIALQCVSGKLKEQCREVDLAARLGGEEFGILLPDTKLEDAAILAERIRASIETMSCLAGDIPVHLTASLGVASMDPEIKDLDALVHNADAAMYQAKNNGRNRVEKFIHAPQE